MFYIINRTRHKQDDSRKEWPSKKWPPAEDLPKFGSPGDTLELVELETEEKSYYGVKYIKQTVYTLGMERIAPTGNEYVTPQGKAVDWLAEVLKPTGLVLPTPRCGKCYAKTEENGQLQSMADCGLCWSCRTPKKDVIVPRPKKD